jgi:hypothetical protein
MEPQPSYVFNLGPENHVVTVLEGGADSDPWISIFLKLPGSQSTYQLVRLNQVGASHSSVNSSFRAERSKNPCNFRF